MSFRLEEGWTDRLMYQLRADCSLLEQCHVGAFPHSSARAPSAMEQW